MYNSQQRCITPIVGGSQLNISIDRNSKTSIQEQIKLEIAQRIRSGLLEEDYALPSVRQLSHCLNISLVTAHRVYKSLEKDELIKTIRGKGTFVKRHTTLHIDDPQGTNTTSLDPYNWHLSIPDYLPRASFWSQSSVRLPPQFLDMATASIHHSLLPLTLLQASMQKALQQYPQSLGSYSPYQGDPDFLKVICDYFANQGLSLRPHQLIVTNGTQQGLNLFARTFLGPQDVIAMETPCFSGAIDVFRFNHTVVQPIPIDAEGIRIDILEELAARTKIKAIYTVPTYQNPTGTIMSLNRRKDLLEFAENNNILILEDDPHRELSLFNNNWAIKPPPTLKSLDKSGRVIYLKGFSKFLFPGLRLGVIVANGTIYNRLLAAKSISDLGSPLWLQKALIPLFSSPQLVTFIKNLNQKLTSRSSFVMKMLTNNLDPEIKFKKIYGGMHLWLTLPPEISADTLLTVAHSRGIHFLPGSIFYPGEPESNHLRICWTNLSDDNLPKALDILCDILNNAIRNP